MRDENYKPWKLRDTICGLWTSRLNTRERDNKTDSAVEKNQRQKEVPIKLSKRGVCPGELFKKALTYIVCSEWFHARRGNRTTKGDLSRIQGMHTDAKLISRLVISPTITLVDSSQVPKPGRYQSYPAMICFDNPLLISFTPRSS